MSQHKPLQRTANPALAEAMHALRSSGAAGPHRDRRSRRRRTRASSKHAAIRDQTA